MTQAGIDNRLQRDLAQTPTASVAQAERHLFRELNPNIDRSPILIDPEAPPRKAAVLIPILAHSGEPTVLFTVRPKTMPSHAGEISLPGGGIQKGDDGFVGTALRETSEEVGLPASAIEVLGQYGVHHGGRGFAVTPVVGLVDPTAPITPSDREVDAVFEVPLSYLLDPTNHLVEERAFGEYRYRMFAVPYAMADGVRHIWGLTAGILDTLSKAYTEVQGR